MVYMFSANRFRILLAKRLNVSHSFTKPFVNIAWFVFYIHKYVNFLPIYIRTLVYSAWPPHLLDPLACLC